MPVPRVIKSLFRWQTVVCVVCLLMACALILTLLDQRSALNATHAERARLEAQVQKLEDSARDTNTKLGAALAADLALSDQLTTLGQKPVVAFVPTSTSAPKPAPKASNTPVPVPGTSAPTLTTPIPPTTPPTSASPVPTTTKPLLCGLLPVVC